MQREVSGSIGTGETVAAMFVDGSKCVKCKASRELDGRSMLFVSWYVLRIYRHVVVVACFVELIDAILSHIHFLKCFLYDSARL